MVVSPEHLWLHRLALPPHRGDLHQLLGDHAGFGPLAGHDGHLAALQRPLQEVVEHRLLLAGERLELSEELLPLHREEQGWPLLGLDPFQL